jgi:hypothetical protein
VAAQFLNGNEIEADVSLWKVDAPSRVTENASNVKFLEVISGFGIHDLGLARKVGHKGKGYPA